MRSCAVNDLPDVVSLVELMDIAATRKLRQGTFPADLLTAGPARTRTLDSEYVRNWVAQQLKTWKLA